MSHSQFHCTGRVYLDLHGLIFETSICYWQDQPGSPQSPGRRGDARPTRALGELLAERTPRGRGLQRGGGGGGPKLGSLGLPAVIGRRGRDPGGVSAVGFEKHRVCRRRRRVRGGWVVGSRGTPHTLSPATGSVGGQLGRTGRLGLATERSARGGTRRKILRAGPSRP